MGYIRNMSWFFQKIIFYLLQDGCTCTFCTVVQPLEHGLPWHLKSYDFASIGISGLAFGLLLGCLEAYRPMMQSSPQGGVRISSGDLWVLQGPRPSTSHLPLTKATLPSTTVAILFVASYCKPISVYSFVRVLVKIMVPF